MDNKMEQQKKNIYKPDFTGKRIWMYWPDEKARQFKENVEKGFMACGLPDDKEVGDLNEIMSVRGGFDAALKDAYGAGSRSVSGRKLLREFANVMREGDFVIARKEFDNIVGVGIVTGDYYYDGTRPRFRHCRKVEWIDTHCWPFIDELKCKGKWHRVTLIDQHYRKIAEQIITWICEEDDDEVKDSIKLHTEEEEQSCCRNGYEDNSYMAFMNKARNYQESNVRQWAKQLGKACIWDERPNHGVWLKDEYALQGLVFYEGFRQEIMDLYHAGVTKIGMNLLNNALRSEHIPYNLFFPMMKKQNNEATKNFFNEMLGVDDIAEVLKVRIEYAPQPKQNYLNDGTAFDAFVLYRHQNNIKGAIGIEVKYTEREYHIGETEYRNTHDESGRIRLSEHYRRATIMSGYYLPESEEELVSDNLRQIWRNHILGASMVLHGDINHFTSMTVFPNANPHFHAASADYRRVLTEKGKRTFFTFTYEEMFEKMSHHFCTEKQQKWIDYLYERYLFGTEQPKGVSTDVPDRYLSKTLNRGVSAALIDAFKHSPVYALYLQHPDELLIGVRNNYLNVYYRLNNIAEVRLAGDSISCGIHPYFLRRNEKGNVVLTGNEIELYITDRYEAIKHLVENKKTTTMEKVAQQMLVMQNNASPLSKWFCVDVEWARSFNNQAEKDSCMASRMDIIAVSKEAPHRVAIIELKYGNKVISGDSGVLKHIQDFKTFKEGSIHDGCRIDYYEGMCTDICNILKAYDALGITLPESLKNLSKEQFSSKPEFYVLTLDNNAVSWGATTPKQTMAAYLFSPNSRNYRAWGCRQPAKDNVQDKLGIDVLDASSELPVTFIFSNQTISNLHVNDILEDDRYDIIRPIK
ncbi:MAG: hypothetical protein IJR02_12300 [Bacteroidaceae bacterium]|nr:hypothetical protein [Bacteroidaceae bacterium]